MSDIARILAEAGDVKQALEVAEQVDDKNRKAWALHGIAIALTTESAQEDESFHPDRSVAGRMKRSFTPEERQLAKQLVEALQDD